MIRSDFDAQAISGTNGPGPFKIVNNDLQASGECIAWGGGDPHITDLVPADIEVRGNYIHRPLAWQSDPRWTYKNLYESKNSERVLVTGNVFEDCWVSAQTGYGIVLWSINQDHTASWCRTAHYTVLQNEFHKVTTPISIVGVTNIGGTVDTPCHHVTIRQNLFYECNDPQITPNGVQSALLLVQGGPSEVTWEHNTGINTYSVVLFDNTTTVNFIGRYNVVGNSDWVVLSGGGPGINSPDWLAIAGSGSVFTNNVVWSSGANPIANNTWQPDLATVGFVGGQSIAGFKLRSDSIYKGTADNGTDPGFDSDALAASVASVRS
jgi:hypothetical protein